MPILFTLSCHLTVQHRSHYNQLQEIRESHAASTTKWKRLSGMDSTTSLTKGNHFPIPLQVTTVERLREFTRAHSQYCEWSQLMTISQPFYNVSRLLIKGSSKFPKSGKITESWKKSQDCNLSRKKLPGIDYEMKAFVGDGLDDKPHKRWSFFYFVNISQPFLEVRRLFTNGSSKSPKYWENSQKLRVN